MFGIAMAEGPGVRLKRKVRSTETKLFEWRPCGCTVVASEGRLLLQLQTPPLDQDGREDENAETVAIDLASQLLNVVSKKNKARCDLEYYASATGSIGDILKEELMAPSAAHCQQWMAQVQRFQQQAQQKQQRRSGSNYSSPGRPAPAASPVAPLPPSHVELNGSRNSRTSNASNGDAVSSLQSVAARESSPLPLRRTTREMSGSQLGPLEAVSSSSIPQSVASQPSGSSSLSSSSISYTLPDSLAAVARAASYRDRGRCDPVQTTIDDADLDTVDSSTGSPAPVLQPTSHSGSPPILTPPISVSTSAPQSSTWRRSSVAPNYSSSSSESEVMHTSQRRSQRYKSSSYRSEDFDVSENNGHGSDDDHPSRLRRRSLRRSGKYLEDSRRRRTSISRDYPPLSGHLNFATSSSSSRSPPRDLSIRSGWHENLPLTREDGDSTAYEGEGESSRAELHILQRVEAALRALELENAQFKARERELTQEIQTLRDGARVAAAERKHNEQEFRHARREIDSWRRAAQSAEAAATHLHEQLGIAREENQLLVSEKLRLKRQNGELLTQVHRLDSLVYGRF